MSDQSEALRAALAAAHSKSKRELVVIARTYGWTGDEARTPKDALAEYVAHAMQGDMSAAVAAEARIRAEQSPQPELAMPMQQPQAPQAPTDAAAAALALVQALTAGVKAPLDPDAVRALIRAELDQREPVRVIVNGPRETRIDERTHPLFPKVLRLVAAGVNVLLVGPAGCGKSYLAKQVAKALGREFGTLHCSAGVSESQVTGWLLPTGEGGRFVFRPSQFAVLYSRGNSLFLLDEIDAADPNMLTVLNGATANGALHIPQDVDNPVWLRGNDAAIVAAANTWGTGADSLYVGRNQLDAATLDRFYIVAMDYDAALEAQIAGLDFEPGKPWQAAPEPTSQELADLGAWVLNLRARAMSAKLRRVVSTRTLQKACAARCAGVPADEVKADILAGWTADERAKAGV